MVDACYLRVFYEEQFDADSADAEQDAELSDKRGLNFRWETRHAELYRLVPELDDKVNVQHIPYVICALTCLGLYWWELLSSLFCASALGANGVLTDWIAILAGVAVTLLCLLVFLCHRKLNLQKIIDGWYNVKQTEQGS